MPQGRVKWFNENKGYGYITVSPELEVFVHFSVIEMEGYRSLAAGQLVELDFVGGEMGPLATRVKLLQPGMRNGKP